MEKQSSKHECRLIAVAIVSALLVVIGHLILSKSFSNMPLLEYTAAAIPFLMFALCLYGIRYASKVDIGEKMKGFRGH
ncbi:hypothetical protein [Vibrio hepatarius]|uniref:Asparaginyl-tRNA synthetase n=2 Tax=Vibrio hepatarius TaxID=171383 RepID=A0A0M0I257_9VIBR|nr:hypothetical protein [Vibrio hepatarius]KOO08415.1 asparaginyl-tRNA synthetase [Vibrio hepatarius]